VEDLNDNVTVSRRKNKTLTSHGRPIKCRQHRRCDDRPSTAGDLSRKITVDAQGEILELKRTIKTMVDQLNEFGRRGDAGRPRSGPTGKGSSAQAEVPRRLGGGGRRVEGHYD